MSMKTTKPWLPASLLPVCMVFSIQAMADNCYLLKSAKGETLHNSETPPFDLSFPPPSKAYEASRARGEQLLILDGTDCFDEEEHARRLAIARQVGAWRVAHPPRHDWTPPRSQSGSPTDFPGEGGSSASSSYPGSQHQQQTSSSFSNGWQQAPLYVPQQYGPATFPAYVNRPPAFSSPSPAPADRRGGSLSISGPSRGGGGGGLSISGPRR